MKKRLSWLIVVKAVLCRLPLALAIGCGNSARSEKEPAKSAAASSAPNEKKPSEPPKTETVISDACAAAMRLVCTEIGEDSGVCGLMRDSAKRMTEERCEKILADPEKTLREMRTMEESRMPLSEEKRARIETGNAPSWGPDNAPVTVTVFSNLDCDPCVKMGAVVPRLAVWYPGKVRVVHRIHPAVNPESDLAGQAVYAADEQGKFGVYYDCLMNNQHDMSLETIERCAREVGLSVKPFLKAMKSDAAAEAVRRDHYLGEEMLVGRPPFFFVNGVRVSPGDGEPALRRAIEDAIRKLEGPR